MAVVNRFLGGFRKLTLTQQVISLILLSMIFLGLFFVFFLSDSVTQTITGQMFDMISSRQQPVVRALNMGKTAAFDRELFEYLGSDPYMSTFVVNSSGVL